VSYGTYWNAEKRAVAWDRLVTVVIVVLLFFPLPFVRFQVMPQLVTVLERPILPWSEFEIAMYPIPRGSAIPELRLHLEGNDRPQDRSGKPSQRGAVFPITPVNEPLLRWQSNPEIRLGELFVHGEMLKVSSFWQPLLFYPLHIGWQARLN